MIKYIRIGLFFGVVVCTGMGVFAQAAPPKQQKPTVKPVTTNEKSPLGKADTSKIITLKTKFGPINGNLPVSIEDFLKLVNSPLLVTDQKGQNWPVKSFRFGWDRIEINDDWKTGKRKTVVTFHATDVRDSTHIPYAWQQELKEGLQSGEVLKFENILATNPATKNQRYAPDFQIHLIKKE